MSAIEKLNSFFKPVDDFINPISDVLYFPILLILLLGCGIYFTFRTRGIQFRRLGRAFGMVKDKPEKEGDVSGAKALSVSIAAAVGSGNIVGVAEAICIGGPGAVFWMWITALVGMASSFIESTLAQVYKRRGDGESYGGPSYYIEKGLGSRGWGIAFAVFLILTYAVGFNLLASYNLQSAFSVFDFYEPTISPWVIGGICAVLTGIVIFGGGKRIMDTTNKIIPVMGAFYIVIAIVTIIMNAKAIPGVFSAIFTEAFNFRAVAGGMAGTALVQGIRRGLYSNEAGMGSSPNAAAAADVRHPAKQGLIQMLAVFIDTIIFCTATALMGLSSGVAPTEELAGSPWIQTAMGANFGTAGQIFLVIALGFFVFSTFIGNIYFSRSCVLYINKGKLSKGHRFTLRLVAVVLILLGASMQFSFAWDLADFLMAFMVLINVPVLFALGGQALRVMKDYDKQLKAGEKEPVFKAENVDLDLAKLDYWK